MTGRCLGLLGLLCLQPACSFLMMAYPPPQADQLPAFACPTEWTPPLYDVMGAAISTGLGVQGTLLGADAPAFRNASIAAGAVGLVAFGASALYGYSARDACHEARQAWRTLHPDMQLGEGGLPSLGCSKDTDCRYGRHCRRGTCTK